MFQLLISKMRALGEHSEFQQVIMTMWICIMKKINFGSRMEPGPVGWHTITLTTELNDTTIYSLCL